MDISTKYNPQNTNTTLLFSGPQLPIFEEEAAFYSTKRSDSLEKCEIEKSTEFCTLIKPFLMSEV